MSLTDDILMHYGMPRRSGRYPWGSGDNPYQHSGDFLSRVEELKKSNFTFTDKDGKTYTGEVAIAKSMGLSTTQFRTQMSLAKDERRSADVATAKALRANVVLSWVDRLHRYLFDVLEVDKTMCQLPAIEAKSFTI